MLHLDAIVFVCNKKEPEGLFVHRYDSMEEGEVNSQEEKQEAHLPQRSINLKCK